MKGKVIPVMDFNLTFGKASKMLEIYAAFKYKKNGNQYIVYKVQEENNNILSLGSVHFKNNSVVILNIKEVDMVIVKEFVYKLIRNEELDKFELLNLDKIEKAEIISENKLTVEVNTITKLNEMMIPKPEVIKEEFVEKKKGHVGIILTIILIFLALGGIFIYIYINKIFNDNSLISCYKEYSHQEIEAKVKEDYRITFENKNLVTIDKIITYTFASSIKYFDYKDNNKYYDYMEKGSTYKLDDENLTYKEFMGINLNDSNIPSTYDQTISYYQSKGYSCIEVKYE